MDKKMVFNATIARHIAWNKLINEMLDTWLSVKIVKNIDTGEVTITADIDHE